MKKGNWLFLAFVALGYVLALFYQDIGVWQVQFWDQEWYLGTVVLWTVFVLALWLIYLLMQIVFLIFSPVIWLFSWPARQRLRRRQAHIRSAIQHWLLSENDSARYAMEKALQYQGDLVAELMMIPIMVSQRDWQGVDNSVMFLVRSGWLDPMTSACLRARIYRFGGQEILAVAVLEQYLTKANRLVLRCYTEVLLACAKTMDVQLLDKFMVLLQKQSRLKDYEPYRQLAIQVLAYAADKKDGRFAAVFDKTSYLLSNQDRLYFEFVKFYVFADDQQSAVSYLLKHLSRRFYLKLYQQLGRFSHQVEEQMQVARKWLTLVPESLQNEVFARLHFHMGDQEQALRLMRQVALPGAKSPSADGSLPTDEA